MSSLRILIAEPAIPIANALKKFLNGWAEVQHVSYLDEAVQLVRARAPDVLIAAVSSRFDGETLAPQVRKQSPEVAIILSYAADEERAPERAREAGADGFLVGPPKRAQVLGMVQAVSRLNGLASALRDLQVQFEAVKQKASRAVGRPEGDDAYFKRYMLLEVKRSKRYQYPLAMLLVSLDNLSAHLGHSAPEFQRDAIASEALERLQLSLRDIDVAMSFAQDKFLLFLPHTPLRGATVVAQRVVERLRTLDSFSGGTASVGVASHDPHGTPVDPLTFGGLVRGAAEALKRAQAAGGNRFDAPALPEGVRRGRIFMG